MFICRRCLHAFVCRLSATASKPIWRSGPLAVVPPGRFAHETSGQTARRFPVGFSSSVNSRAATHLFERVCHSRYCRRLLRRGVGDFPLSPRRRTGSKVSACRVGYRHYRFHLPRFVSGLLNRRSAGLTIGSDGNRLRLPPTPAFSVFGGCSAPGASTYSAALGLNRTRTVLATPSADVSFHLQPRRVRSDAGHRRRRLFAAQTRSVPAIFPAISFLLPFPHLGDMSRGLFFLHKVRSPTQLPSGSLKPAPPISLRAFSAALGIVKRACLCSHLHEKYHDNFTKNGTSLIFSRYA